MLSPQVLARSTAFVGLSGATFGTIFQQRTHQEECCFGSRTPIGGIHKDTANTLYKVMLQCNFVESRIKVLARILCKSCVGRAWTKMVYKYTHTCILHMYIIYMHMYIYMYNIYNMYNIHIQFHMHIITYRHTHLCATYMCLRVRLCHTAHASGGTSPRLCCANWMITANPW